MRVRKPSRRAGVMAAVLAALAGSAAAQNRMSIGAGDALCFAYVLIEDRAGMYNADETLTTKRGPVTVRYRTIGGHAAPDVADVLTTPPDVIAVPPTLDLTPSAVNRICLMEWSGM